jgi:HSP20 family molecular chaperone IbpA
MTEQTAAAVQRAPAQSAAVRVVEPQALIDRINQVYQAIARRAFEFFESEGGAPGRDVEHWLQAEAELLRPVPVNVAETDDALTVQAEVPGFNAGDLQVSVESGQLAISGKQESREEQKKGKAIYREQRSSEILRVITLPAAVDASKATATLTNGIIELILPKAAKAQAARVEVKKE